MPWTMIRSKHCATGWRLLTNIALQTRCGVFVVCLPGAAVIDGIAEELGTWSSQMCLCVRERARVRACVCVCARARVRASMQSVKEG